MTDTKTENVKLNAAQMTRDGGAVAFRFAALMGMLMLIMVVGLIAYESRRPPVLYNNPSKSGALELNMMSGAVVKNGMALSGAYKSPRAVSVYYVINGADNTVLGSGSMELNERSQFSREILINSEQIVSNDATLQVFVKDQKGQAHDTIALPVKIESVT